MIARRLVTHNITAIGGLLAPMRDDKHGPPVLTNGLVLYVDPANPYSYDSTSSTIKDLSGSGNDGTLLNTPTFEADRGGIFSFDGVNDNINCGRGASLTIADNISVSFWIRWPTGFGSGWQSAVTKRRPFTLTAADQQATFIVNWNPNAGTDQFQMAYYSPAGTIRSLVVTLSTSFAALRWYHVACVWEKSSTNTVMRMYRDGLQIATSTTAGNILSYSNLDLRIAATDASYSAPYGVEYGLCRMGQVLVYNRALSAAEVWQTYQSNRWRFAL